MKLYRELNGNARVPSALALHQCTNGPEAGAGALQRNWFEKYEVRSHGEGTFQCRLAVDRSLPIENGNGDRPPIRWRGSSPVQYSSRDLRSRAIDNDGLESLTGELLRGAVCVRTMLYPDFHFAQNAAKHADDFVILTEQQ